MAKKTKRKRGSKRGVKRGQYRKHKPRKYPSLFKTTTPEGYREYMRNLMRLKLGIPPSRYGKRGRKPKRFLLKDFEDILKKVR